MNVGVEWSTKAISLIEPNDAASASVNMAELSRRSPLSDRILNRPIDWAPTGLRKRFCFVGGPAIQFCWQHTGILEGRYACDRSENWCLHSTVPYFDRCVEMTWYLSGFGGGMAWQITDEPFWSVKCQNVSLELALDAVVSHKHKKLDNHQVYCRLNDKQNSTLPNCCVP